MLPNTVERDALIFMDRNLRGPARRYDQTQAAAIRNSQQLKHYLLL